MTRWSRAFRWERIVEHEDVWNAGLFFVSSRSDFITGQILCLDGGITATE